MTKRKEGSFQTEVEITPDNRGQFEEFGDGETADSLIDTGHPPEHFIGEGTETGLFHDLKESILEAAAILRGEREAARRTHIEDPYGSMSGHEQD